MKAAKMAVVEYGAGEVIFKQGYPAQDSYIIEKGKVEIYLEHVDGSEQLLATLGEGQMFGEEGPMTMMPRSASARAIERTVLQVITL